jgi:hypothetical protein
MLEILLKLSRRQILQRSGQGPGTKSLNPRDELFGFLVKLLPGERLSKERVPMVTAVLSLLDHSLATGQAVLPGRTLSETRRARQLLERAVLEVIPDWEWFEHEEEERFDLYCSWLAQLYGRAGPGRLAIITTNYDMVADVAAMRLAGVRNRGPEPSLTDLARKIDFGFRWVRPDSDEEEGFSRPAQPRISLYKLHGSTNWLRCPLCENVYVNPSGPISWKSFAPRSGWANQCHCSATRLEAQIVSPSFIREMHEPNLIAVWKNTLDFLRGAGHWIIIGYGFPDEDVGIRALFTRAFGSHGAFPRISVVQLDDKARLNYESFFPDDALRYLTGGLDLLIDRWKIVRRQTRRRKTGRPHR